VCRAIDAAREVDEVTEIRDKARALEVYSQQAKNVEAERKCCEIRLRAERKAGELLQQTERAKGGRSASDLDYGNLSDDATGFDTPSREGNTEQPPANPDHTGVGPTGRPLGQNRARPIREISVAIIFRQFLV
jgi:hypothetical protein